MNNSFKANESQIEQIIEYYKDYQVLDEKLLFKAKSDSFVVSIYANKTVFFQGKDAKVELLRWAKIDNYEEIVEHIGSDEVGCGDYFGPIVVCATYVSEKDYPLLKQLNVQDSKNLSDKTIESIASVLKEKIQYVSFVLSNKKYNEITFNMRFNMNKIKAYLHNFVLSKLVELKKYHGLVVVDQFCSEKLYYEYLEDFENEQIFKDITFTTKAESKYLAVASASIIARSIFIEQIQKMSKELGKTILLGANEKVDNLAKEIYQEKGLDYLSNYVKLNFKNTKKLYQ